MVNFIKQVNEKAITFHSSSLYRSVRSWNFCCARWIRIFNPQIKSCYFSSINKCFEEISFDSNFNTSEKVVPLAAHHNIKNTAAQMKWQNNKNVQEKKRNVPWICLNGKMCIDVSEVCWSIFGIIPIDFHLTEIGLTRCWKIWGWWRAGVGRKSTPWIH